ncbi:hypothetical protein GGR51DRAFT_536560 [Nemania sp. FL0031]|nr:hypothetical protein GGR51DRAFT_536560 [Nemania sp. FL0031]
MVINLPRSSCHFKAYSILFEFPVQRAFFRARDTMSAAERDRTVSMGEGRATRAEVVNASHESDSAATRKLSVQRDSEEIQVTIKIYSDDDECLTEDTSDEDDDIPTTLFDPFGEHRWSKQINGFVNVGQSRVADCDAKLLRRDSIRSAFWTEMEELCEETSLLAFELFDRYGRLNREYSEHEIRKGSGIWGKELDHGDILMVENIHIEPLWRRQGVGTKLVSAVLDKARHESKSFFAFVNPMHLTQDNDEKPDSGTIREQSENFKHFFRSLGFRRVGASGWLAFTNNDSHPSRHLDKAQDWDAPVQLKEEQITPEPIRTILSSLSNPSISGAECVSKMEVFSAKENELLQVYTDEVGNTILHMAAIGRKAELISYIMSKVPQLAEKRNSDGYTPLEVLQSSLDQQRTRRFTGGVRVVTDVISDSFTGFCQSDIECLAALTGTEIFDLTNLSDRDIWMVSSATDEMASRVREANPIRNTLRLKYGCTCGQCIGGFLSPRMQFALRSQAEIQHDILNEFPGPDCSGADWVEANDDVLVHLPRAVQQNLIINKSMRQGFINMLQHIARCLGKKRLPNTTTILDFYRDEVSEWPPVTRNYLQRGGTVAAVAMMLFDRAIDQDEWAGDGTMMETFEDDINQLPACRNDHEFGFVRAMCGYEDVYIR